ncbi:MAG TPA: NAD(P)-binding domain-containing protein [Phototrophicaceae bacterium]|nr:NAD(P)-binding domain-containing protein [Phototrophicaceae bacterium]
MISPKVCIIGAGASGIAAAKVLHERGIAFDCYEKGSGIGGNWRYKNDNGMSAAYRSLHINTSKTRMAYSDFPMPDHYPDYLHHSQVLEYFENYVDHFGFRGKLTFNTSIENVEPGNPGGYNVTIRDANGTRTIFYDAVIVANGHHWSPRMPEPPFPGQDTFTGRQMHAHEYRVAEDFVGQNVLVVGIGNSGIDISCDISHVANKVYLSTRRGAHIIPKYIMGIPTDLLTDTPVVWAPLWVQQFIMRLTLLIGRGSQKRYGVPVPKNHILTEHPAISSDLLHYVGHGRVKIKPNIDHIKANQVSFDDGSSEPIDSIIYATGYNLCFPFFRPEFITVKDNQFPLYQYAISVDHPGLYFIGLLQPLGAIMPLSEVQSKWIAELVTGACHLPTRTEMQAWITQRYQQMAQRYYRSPRHTLQVDYKPYFYSILKEIEQGKTRQVVS